MDEMYSNYIRQKIDHNYTDNTFEMKCDCHLYVMSVDHVTSNSISFLSILIYAFDSELNHVSCKQSPRFGCFYLIVQSQFENH